MYKHFSGHFLLNMYFSSDALLNRAVKTRFLRIRDFDRKEKLDSRSNFGGSVGLREAQQYFCSA